jgi:hypothetical protein
MHRIRHDLKSARAGPVDSRRPCHPYRTRASVRGSAHNLIHLSHAFHQALEELLIQRQHSALIFRNTIFFGRQAPRGPSTIAPLVGFIPTDL